jgi:hypothetical protein
MRPSKWLFVLTLSLCTTAAFAIDRASVDMPFSFESHGRVFPASQYDVSLDANREMLTLSNRANPADTATFITTPAEQRPNDTTLSIKLDRTGNVLELHAIRLGSHTTPVLDAHSQTR